jgi:hypothetical protein
MDATLILIDSDAELVRARALVDRLWNSEDPGRYRPTPGAGTFDSCLRGEQVAPPTAEHGRTDPASHGSARTLASGYGPDLGNAEPR